MPGYRFQSLLLFYCIYFFQEAALKIIKRGLIFFVATSSRYSCYEVLRCYFSFSVKKSSILRHSVQFCQSEMPVF